MRNEVFPIPMKFDMLIELDKWCTTVCCMTQSKVKVTSQSRTGLIYLQCIFELDNQLPPPFFGEHWWTGG